MQFWSKFEKLLFIDLHELMLYRYFINRCLHRFLKNQRFNRRFAGILHFQKRSKFRPCVFFYSDFRTSRPCSTHWGQQRSSADGGINGKAWARDIYSLSRTGNETEIGGWMWRTGAPPVRGGELLLARISKHYHFLGTRQWCIGSTFVSIVFNYEFFGIYHINLIINYSSK